MVNKHKQKKKRRFKNYRKTNKEFNALIEKNQKNCREQKRRKTEKELEHFQKMQISNEEDKKKVSQAWQKG